MNHEPHQLTRSRYTGLLCGVALCAALFVFPPALSAAPDESPLTAPEEIAPGGSPAPAPEETAPPDAPDQAADAPEETAPDESLAPASEKTAPPDAPDQAADAGVSARSGLDLSWLTGDLLWTGSWGLDGNLIDRGDVRFNAFGFTARFQVVDKRPAYFWESTAGGNTAFGGGLYHNRTGSRLLYGTLDEWGLPARLRNPWGKSLPFAEAHKPSAADIRTEPSSTKTPEAYLYLGSPQLGRFRLFAAVRLNQAAEPSLSGGLDTQLAPKTSLRFEGFYTGGLLPPRAPSSWFSDPPHLPEREFRLYGAGLFFTSPFFAAAADGAYSETFAWGRDLYGNLSLRVGDKPWQFNIGVEAGGSRFTDREGSAVGSGFRTAAKFEWKGKRTSLFRVSAVLRAPAIGEAVDRGSVTAYYHFPSTLKTGWAVPLQPVRVSVTASRDERNREKITNSAELSLRFNVGPVGTSLQTTIADAAGEFNSAKVSGDLTYAIGLFQFKTKLGYTAVNGKDPVWDTAFSASIRGSPGRFTLKISSPSLPDTWDLSLSWRLDIERR